ncbi:UPF0236 family transposase-like protein [Enterocloster citroniae]|uniref:ISLre2 family transposase n=2 Tax=Enterocloster citroniae TaxID=358743 RepID=A0ABV2G509_9FIRM|nr:UPF0236 family protein [Enterocloster citroniae]KMW10709.1 hypothetical protein HMPREF9470_05559 [[Clostridium] citroniae WAL-19142]
MVAKESTERKKIFRWGEENLDIVELEVAIFRFVLKLARELMKGMLEAVDQDLARNRDASELRNKGYRNTVFKSIFGEVEYRRHVYVLTQRKKSRPAMLYLLDEAMGLSTIGTYSETICQMAVESACTTSYRNAAGFLSNMTGQTISHQTVWNIVQNIGKQGQHRTEELAEAALGNASAGEYQTSILYEEMDGVYLSLQGKNREGSGASKELKVSIAYSGVNVDKNGHRNLANKVAYASFEDPKSFKNHTEGIVAGY